MDPEIQPVPARLITTLACVLILGLACGVGYKPNLGAEQLSDTKRPHALIVGYLSQTSADPAVCDLGRRDGVAIPFADKRVVNALVKGLESGAIPPERWVRCVSLMWRDADSLLSDQLGAGLVAAAGRVRARDLSEIYRPRVDALLRVLVDRPTEEPLPTGKLERTASHLRSEAGTAGPDSERGMLLGDLAECLEAELGVFDGQPVSAAEIGNTRQVSRLSVWARRLPDLRLRRLAGETLVGRRIERSPYAWVQQNAERVIDAAVRGPVEVPDDLPLVRAEWRPRADGTTVLRVLQQPLARKVYLLPTAADGTRSADPSLALAGSLWVDVDGFEKPVTICDVDQRFDPTPCITPDRLAMTHSVAILAPSGRITFPIDLRLGEVLKLGSDGDRLSAQIVIDGLVAQLDMPIVFDSVPELWMKPYGKGNGPDAQVEVWELSNERLLIEVKAINYLGRKKWKGVIESTDRAFSIVSEGIETDHQVGRGGTITVKMHCTRCKAVKQTLRRMVRSTGAAPGKVIIRRAKN